MFNVKNFIFLSIRCAKYQ